MLKFSSDSDLASLLLAQGHHTTLPQIPGILVIIEARSYVPLLTKFNRGGQMIIGSSLSFFSHDLTSRQKSQRLK